MPDVSIILPVYNSEKYIEKTIKSILKQTYSNWELIVVDDCSQDNSLNIIKNVLVDKNIYPKDTEMHQFAKYTIIKNKQNIGAALSRNIAINKAKGRYIAFIDSDDIWNDEKLEKQISFMKANNIAFSFSSYERIKENGKAITRVEVPEVVAYKELLKNTIILNSTVILDTYSIDKELIKMPNLKVAEDTAMFLKILRYGYVANGLNECLIKYTIRRKSLSSNKIRNIVSQWKIYKDYENINFYERIKSLVGYIKNATKKRVPKRTI